MKWTQLYSNLNIPWHCSSLELEWKVTFSGLLQNLYAGQKAMDRPRHGTMDCSKLGKEYIKAVYCHPASLTYMLNTSCEMPADRSKECILGWTLTQGTGHLAVKSTNSTCVQSPTLLLILGQSFNFSCHGCKMRMLVVLKLRIYLIE